MEITAQEARILDLIDEEALVKTLQALVAVASLGGSDGELKVQEVAARELEAQGLNPTLYELDLEALRDHPLYPGEEVTRTRALGVEASFGTGNGPRLILNGHLDVVPVGDLSQWQADPWAGIHAGGTLYGRGSCDMKGGVAAIIHAVGALVKSGEAFPGTIQVQTVIGEEDGGIGAFAAALREPQADGAIIAEPTGLQPMLAQAGSLTFRLIVHGKAAHGALRLAGYSAVDAYLPLHQALRDLETRRNSNITHPLMRNLQQPYPISIGIVQAGDWPSTVPETLIAEGRYGVIVGESPAEARAVLEEVIAETVARDPWLREHPPTLEWWGGQFDTAEIALDHPLVKTLEGAMQTQGLQPQPFGAPYGSDMRLLQLVGGTPTLLFGPGDVRLAHQRDESIEIAQIITCARALVLTALRFGR